MKENLKGRIVKCTLPLHDGDWAVFEDNGGPCVKIQRPQDFKGRWVNRKFIISEPVRYLFPVMTIP